MLRAATNEIRDLADPNTLGLGGGSTIVIDINAAGRGWFIDSTPSADEEFNILLSSSDARASSGPAVDRVDLLTTVMHEFGHLLGFDDHSDSGLLADTLPIGVRRTLTLPRFVSTSLNLAVENEVTLENVGNLKDSLSCFGHLNRRSQLPEGFPGKGRDCQVWDGTSSPARKTNDELRHHTLATPSERPWRLRMRRLVPVNRQRFTLGHHEQTETTATNRRA